MDRYRSPALLPAAGWFLGTWLAPELTHLPLGAVAVLLAFALALGRPAGRAVAFCALGLLNAGVRGAPADPHAWLDQERPVELAGRVLGHPSSRDDHLQVRLRADTLRQGTRVETAELDVWLSLPADATPPAFGSRLRLRGHLRHSSAYANHPEVAVRPTSWRMRIKSERFVTVEQPPGRLAAAGTSLRRRLEDRLDALGGHRRSPALVRALVLGDSSRLPKVWQQALRRSGLGHLLAISGLHVGLLTVWLLILAAPLPVRWRVAVGAAGTVVYVLVAGPRPSILRASAMACLAAFSLISERPPQTWNALAAGVVLLLLWEPALAHDLGFQLSVAATAGVVAVAGGREEKDGRRRRRSWRTAVARAVKTSLAAQLMTLPLVVSVSGTIHPAALLLNLVAIPWLAIFLVLTLLWAVAGSLWSPAAALVLPVLEWTVAPLDGLASLPPSAFLLYAVGPLSGVASLLAASFALGLHRPGLAAGLSLLGLTLCLTEAAPGRAAGPAEAIFLDVGQGDAILLRDGEEAALVDGGGWPEGDLGGRVLVPALAALGVSDLDALVLTHPDSDHCNGLVDVARYLPSAELWMAPGWADDGCARELAASPGLGWRPLWRGRRARLGRWRLEVLHPAADAVQGRNDRSLVILAEVFGRRLLLTGDVEARTEDELLRRAGPSDLQADVLKVAHHGSKTSTSERFLTAVAPSLAVVSAGASNPYGHPHPTVLARLTEHRVRVLRTDRSGMIRLRFEPSGRIAVETPAAGEGLW